MTRLGLLDVGTKALEVLCRRDRVCRAMLLGPLECHRRVAQLPFERLTRRRSLHHGLLERCPGVRLFQFSLFLRRFERGGRGTQLPRQRVTLIRELGDACSGHRVVSGEALRIRGALRGMTRLGLLDVGTKALELSFCCGTRTRRRRECAVELRLMPAEDFVGGDSVSLAGLPNLLQRRPRKVQLVAERVARPRTIFEAGRKFSVTPGETIDSRLGLRCTLLLGLAQRRLELQQPLLERQADFGGPCRCLTFSRALEARRDELLARLLDSRQLRFEHLPPRALVIERRQQAGLLAGIHLDAIGRKGSEIQRQASTPRSCTNARKGLCP